MHPHLCKQTLGEVYPGSWFPAVSVHQEWEGLVSQGPEVGGEGKKGGEGSGGEESMLWAGLFATPLSLWLPDWNGPASQGQAPP